MPKGTTSQAASTTVKEINAAIAKLGIRKRPLNSHGKAPTTPTFRRSQPTSSASSSPASQRESIIPILTPEKRDELINFIDQAVDDAYNVCHGYGGIRWGPAKTREGVAISRANAEEDGRFDATVRGKCNINASFEELMDTLITESTEDFISHEIAVHSTEFLDGQLIYTLVPRTTNDRFVCVKWHCIQSLSQAVTTHRDYIYVEVVDQFTDRDGRKVGYRLSKSIELDGYIPPRQYASLRGKTLTFSTFSALEDGTLDYYILMVNDLGEKLPGWHIDKVVITAAMRAGALRDYIDQKRMDALVFANPADMVPLSKRFCCFVCTRSFSLVRKKYNCVVCGEVMCNQCGVHQMVATQRINKRSEKKKARVCIKCNASAKNRELPRRSNLRHSELQSQNMNTMQSPSQSPDLEQDRAHSMYLSKTSETGILVDNSIRSTVSTDICSIGSTGSNMSVEESSRIYPTGDRSSTPQMSSLFGGNEILPSSGGKSAPESSLLSSQDFEDIGNLLIDNTHSVRLQLSATSQRFSSSRTNPPKDLDLGIGKYKASYAKQTSEINIASVISGDHQGEESQLLSSHLIPETVAKPSPAQTSHLQELGPSIPPTRKRSMPPPPPPSELEPLPIKATIDDSEELELDLLEEAPVEIVKMEMLTTEEAEVMIVEPMIVRQVSRRYSQLIETTESIATEEVEAQAQESDVTEPDASELPQSEVSDSVHLRATNAHLDAVDNRVSIQDEDLMRSTHDTSETFEFSMERDECFSTYLVDSSFEDVETSDGEENRAPVGWKSVHSKTTGQVYYYNESCGATSWTLPTSEMKEDTYMVL